jgi:hypothetical protein
MDFWILGDGDSGYREWWNWELGFGERENEEVTEREWIRNKKMTDWGFKNCRYDMSLVFHLLMALDVDAN